MVAKVNEATEQKPFFLYIFYIENFQNSTKKKLFLKRELDLEI